MTKFRLRTILADEDLALLCTKSEVVPFVVLGDGTLCLDGETMALIAALKQFVIDNNGLGMSAIQLGVLKRIIVVRRNSDELVTIINPRNAETKTVGIQCSEQCFSVPTPPGVSVKVIRGGDTDFEYDTETGQCVKERFKGKESRILQHEMDHLEGKLIISKEKFQGWSQI
jgi:peptide deformylase